MKFFGIKEFSYNLNNETVEILNPWKVKLNQRAYIDKDRSSVVVTTIPHPSLETGGYVEHTFRQEESRDGRKLMVWSQNLYDPKSKKGIKEVHSSVTFITDAGGAAPSRK